MAPSLAPSLASSFSCFAVAFFGAALFGAAFFFALAFFFAAASCFESAASGAADFALSATEDGDEVLDELVEELEFEPEVEEVVAEELEFEPEVEFESLNTRHTDRLMPGAGYNSMTVVKGEPAFRTRLDKVA